jgi:hypothetical protein
MGYRGDWAAKYEMGRAFVAGDRQMKALFVLLVASAGAAATVYSQSDLLTGLVGVMSKEPIAILLSGSLLLGLGGALRRCDF